MITTRLAIALAELVTYKTALLMAMNDLYDQRSALTANTPEYRAIGDQIDALSLAYTDTVNRFTTAQVEIVNEILDDQLQVGEVVMRLDRWNIAAPRPVTAPLDPAEPVQYSSDRPMVAKAIIDQLTKAAQGETIWPS